MPASRFRRIGTVLLSGAAACSLASCATGTGGSAIAPGTPITQAEAQEGAQ